MPMMQEDIRRHYENDWKQTSDRAAAQAGNREQPRDAQAGLAYSSPVEDAVLYPIYQRLVEDLGIRVSGGRVLDVGSGSGRWVRFFTERFAPPPGLLVGVDFTQASVDLLERWRPAGLDDSRLRFERADITEPGLRLAALDGGGAGFDLVNIANVLFHVPEADKFARALANLAGLVAPGGRIVTTEYLPRASMRSEWMLVRSRYEFEAAAAAAGLRIACIRPCGFFCNDPMGLDGPDGGVRAAFGRVGAMQKQVLNSKMDPASRDFFRDLFIEVERAALGFCAERLAPVDGPSQKLVVLARA